MEKENNKNSVELLGFYGGDESHACSAWTSTNRELTEKKRARIGELLKDLASKEHGTPFEKSSLHFLVNTDIATHIHIIKHRIGVSCVSGDTEIYIPNPTTRERLNSGITRKTIKQLYEEYNFGILSKSKNEKSYRRIYGRKTPVRTKSPESNLVKKGYISKVFYNGKRKVFEFATKSGYKIKTTEDHKFYTPNGWFTIKEILNLDLVGETAVFSNKDNLVAVNGIQLNNNSRPWTFKEFFSNSEDYTRVEFSRIKNIKLELCKKWGYIHNAQFKKDENQNFKKGQIPWNYKKYGYTLNKKKNGINPNINTGLSYKSWRITVNNWTREQLPKLLKKFNYTCQGQLCLDGCSRDFVGHHVIPVSIDKTRATDFNNLCLVCKDCHKQIHKSRENELLFANKFYKQDLKQTFLLRKEKKGKKLSFRFDTIVNVKYIGFEDVYDLEVDDTHCYVGNGFLLHNCNAESARYKELKEDKYYLPEDWPTNGRWKEILESYTQEGNELYHKCVEELTPILGRKRAKESARFFKTYNSQIAADVMFNFRSFMHFQHLRNSEHAQVEIRWVAQEMLRLVKETGQFNLSLEAFGY